MQRRTLIQSALAAVGASTSVGTAWARPAPARSFDHWNSLRAIARGDLLTQRDPGFTEATRVYAARQGLIPGAVLKAADSDEVALAVAYAKRQNRQLAVRCGGHSYAGHSTCEAGLVIDLSRLRFIRTDAATDTVTVGGGCLVSQIDAVTTETGRAAVLGQCGGVGIGGLVTGGGLGYLMSLHGVAADNLVRAQVVTADSRILMCDEVSEPDLFWAIRGGGGNFGIVTEVTLRTHPIGQVLAGDLIFRTDNLVDLLLEFDAFCATAPDALTLISVIVSGPDGKPYLVAQVCYAGAVDEGETILAPLKASRHLFADRVRAQSYLALQSRVGDVPPSLHMNRSGLCGRLTPALAADLADVVSAAPTRSTVLLVHHHGAAIRPPTQALAYPLRAPGFSWGVTGSWTDEASEAATTAWVLAADARLRRHGTLAYVNTMDVEEQERVRAAYGPNYPRLAAIKRRFDPDNLFQRNQNILPARLDARG